MKTNSHHLQDALHYYLHHLIFKENDMKTFELTQEEINRVLTFLKNKNEQ